MRRRKFALLLLSLVGLSVSASAELRFELLEQRFNVKPEQKSIVARYKFTNTGSEAVKIDGVKTSCGCTTAALTKTDYAPGESGEIAATFNFGGRIGSQEKAILVTVAGAPDKPIILRLNVNIEDPITIQPQFVLWRVGESPSTKAIHIVLANDEKGKIASVTSDNPAIKLDLKELRPGKEYEVRLTPTDVSREASATILIKTDFPAENPQSRYVYARIK
jgi:hypothetical protein